MKMYVRTKYRIFSLMCLFWMQVTSEWSNLTICYVGYSIPNHEEKYCDKIESLSQNQIKCIHAVDRLHCMEMLMANKVDLGVFKAEDLFLASQLNNVSVHDLVITNEFRTFDTQEYEFDMVALVSNKPNVEINSLADLRGKRLCHPGFDEHGWFNDFSEIFLQYFEELVVPEQCDPKLSVLENKISSSESFFDYSCKPGPWSPEPKIDEKMKTKYNKLCDRCSNPFQCSHNDLYWGPQGALTCMLDCNGDVAWAKLQIVPFSFQRDSTSCHDVSYLCLDGTKQPLNTTDPCVWISRPWPVIVTRGPAKKKVVSLISYLNNVSMSFGDSWEYAVRTVLGNSLQPIYHIDPISPMDYLSKVPGYLNASEKRTCQGSGQDIVVKVCIENENMLEKCDLMARVANVYSIDPEFECVLTKNCMDSVASGKTDVYITSIENLRSVYEHGNLKPIMYQTTDDYAELRQSAAVVMNNSHIQVFSELKGKKACFTRYNGLGWNSVLMVLNESSFVNDICDGVGAMKEFFSDVCIIDHQDGDPIRGCFELGDIYEPVGSLHVNEAEGLRCLTVGGGDVAFIDQNYIGQYLKENKFISWDKLGVDNFRSICPPEHAVDSDCYLSRATFGMVLVHNNISEDREDEIVSAFLILSSLLGDKIDITNHEPKLFKLFSHYHNEKNVLFESSAGQLESADQYFTRGRFFVKDFYEINVKSMIDNCAEKERHKNDTSSSNMISNTVIYLFSVLIIIIGFT